MAKGTKAIKALPTIWFVGDELWERVRPILEEFWARKKTGRPPADWRTVLNGIIFRMRTGCQWDQLPKRFSLVSVTHSIAATSPPAIVAKARYKPRAMSLATKCTEPSAQANCTPPGWRLLKPAMRVQSVGSTGE